MNIRDKEGGTLDAKQDLTANESTYQEGTVVEQTHDSGDRWDPDDLDKETTVGVFLDNEEDSLPDNFDHKRVQKQESDHCSLCKSKFTLTFRQHSCRYCGKCVCHRCGANKKRLCKLDKKVYRVCDECDTLLSNQNFVNMYRSVIDKQKVEIDELNKKVQSKENCIKTYKQKHDTYQTQYHQKQLQYAEENIKRNQIIQEKESIVFDLKGKADIMQKQLKDIETQISQIEQKYKMKSNDKNKFQAEYNKAVEKKKQNEEQLETQQSEYKNLSESQDQIEFTDDIENINIREDNTFDNGSNNHNHLKIKDMKGEEKKEATKDAPKKEEAAPEVGQMKRGDYMIHVFIEQARQLKCPDGQPVDPMIEVGCMGVKKYTTAKDDIGPAALVSWNEHLFFEPKNVEVESIEQAKIEIRLLDKGYFKNAVIGEYQFDVAYIYFMKEHSLMHKWLALSNPSSENFNEVSGYLKISITIAATGDEQVQITEDNGADKSDDSVLMPPSIRPEYYQIKFKIFRAEKLPAMDVAILGGKGSIDAYIKCTYLNKELKTKVITQKEGMVVEWNQEFLIPCQLPIMSSRIVMKLFDEDKINDEIVGSFVFNLKDCIGDKNGKFFWKNIYGSPLGVSGDNTDKMNANPEVASTWKGRILMQIEAFKTDKPILICQNITEADKELAIKYTQLHDYEIIAEIGMGISLPANEKYTAMLKIAEFEMKTDKPLQQENNYSRWCARFKQTTFKAPYQDIYDMGRVYLYLLYDGKPICYYRGEIEDFMEPNATYKWVEMTPDLSMGKVSESHKAGILSFKLSIHDKTLNNAINFEEKDAWRKPPPKRLPQKKIRCYIYQCRDLPAADADGQSDPFIKVWDISKQPKKTRIIYDNLNPLFYETLELQYESIGNKEIPPVIFDIYDEDKLGEDFIARCIVTLKDGDYSVDDTVPKPKWFPCRLKPGAPNCGEILASFSVVDDDYSFKIPLNYLRLQESVEFCDMNININILGLRDLQSVGILPVKKAYIVFNLKSLVPPDDGSAIENIKTQPGDAGANPTINQAIKFILPLPVDPLFCPRLSCAVHDYIFKGFNQPLIGVFTIPVGDLIHKLKKEREEETQAIEDVCTNLEQIMNGMGVSQYTSIQEESRSFESFEKDQDLNKMRGTVKRQKVDEEDIEMNQPLLQEERKKDKDYEEEMKASNISGGSPNNRVRLNSKTAMARTSIGGGKKITSQFSAQKFDKFGSGMNKQLVQEEKDFAERNKRDVQDQRTVDLLAFKQANGGRIRNIVSPQYKLDERLNVHRENNIPPESLFVSLGWDEKPTESNTKHYRRYFPDELENIKEIMPVPSPFDQYNIMKGQSRGASKGWWPFKGGAKTDDSGAVSSEQVVGKFKGIIQIESDRDKAEYQKRKAKLVDELKEKLNRLSMKKTKEPLEIKLEKFDTMEGRLKFDAQMDKLQIGHLQITKHLVNLESDETLKRMLMSTTKCVVRVYMINAYDLSSRDNGSFSDPYLKISLGKKIYNERELYQLDNPNPDFYKHYDFEAVFPGCPPLVIDVVDFDDIFGDDSIGKTSIDLEDRYFSPEWQSYKFKPIEYRQLYHPSSSVSQGVVKCWVEIHPTSIPINDIRIFDIKPKPPLEMEMRLVIWDTVDVICMDAEGTSDVYARAFFDSKEETHETDTHYRCQNGKASFNYRLIYKVKFPRKDYNLTLQLYDRDFFKSNDIIGEVQLDLTSIFEDTSLTGKPLSVNKVYYNNYLKQNGFKAEFKDESSFFVPIRGKPEGKTEFQVTGKVRISIDFLPKVHAESNKVGEARQEPNHSPFLPPPVGRISFTLNPFKMFNQLVGPAMRRKVYCYCCIALCCMLCVFLFPIIFGGVLSNLIARIF